MNVLQEKLSALGLKNIKFHYDPSKVDSLYYGNDEQIWTAETDKYVLSCEAHGDIITSEGNDYTNTGMPDDEYQRLQKGEIELENNNWFEILVMEKGTDEWESSLGNVAYDVSDTHEIAKVALEGLK
jgi:hypothetical protein